MIWSLYIDTYRSTLLVVPSAPAPAGDNYLLIAQRDPDQTLEFHAGGFYFNPLFKEGGSLHPYVVNGDNQLISIFTGKHPKKFLKEKAVLVNRGWFELPPRPLTPEDIHPDLLSLIKAQPALHGAIAQVARSTMSLRIPDDVSARTYVAWMEWLTKQRMPLPLRLKVVFQLVSNRPQALVFNAKDQHRLLTGEEPEKMMMCKVRWYQYEVTRILRKQIKESAEWEMELPEAVVQAGETAIMDAMDLKFGPGWRDLSESVPTGITDDDPPEGPDEVIAGPLVWFRPADGVHTPFVPFGPRTSEARPTSINDLFQLAIQNS